MIYFYFNRSNKQSNNRTIESSQNMSIILSYNGFEATFPYDLMAKKFWMIACLEDFNDESYTINIPVLNHKDFDAPDISKLSTYIINLDEGSPDHKSNTVYVYIDLDVSTACVLMHIFDFLGARQKLQEKCTTLFIDNVYKWDILVILKSLPLHLLKHCHEYVDNYCVRHPQKNPKKPHCYNDEELQSFVERYNKNIDTREFTIPYIAYQIKRRRWNLMDVVEKFQDDDLVLPHCAMMFEKKVRWAYNFM